MAASMTIGHVARLANVGVETLRYYEREGLLPPPPRTASGYRSYSPETVARVRFIRRAKWLGFSLSEIRELLKINDTPSSTCADAREMAETKLAEIERKLGELRDIGANLQVLVNTCATGDNPIADCPIIEALDDTIVRRPEGGRRRSRRPKR